MYDIWKYFDKLSTDEAKCTICKKKLKRTDGSTKGLWKHLKSAHSKEFLDLKSNENACEKNEQVQVYTNLTIYENV